MLRFLPSVFLTLIAFSVCFVSAALAVQESEYELQFELVDAETGKTIRDAATLYIEDESTWFGDGESSYDTDAYWLPFEVTRGGKVLYRDRITPEMGKSHFQILANGYRLKQIKLNELLQAGQPIRKTVKLEPLPAVKLKVQRSDGSPVANEAFSSQVPRSYAMTFRTRGGRFMKHLYEIPVKTDLQGQAAFQRPALGEWSWYRIQNDFGHADFSFDDSSAEQAKAQGRVVKLLPRVTIRGRYRAEVRKNEYLRLYALNYDRITGDGEGERVRVREDGSFELGNRLATWHQIVHWSFFIDARGERRAFPLGSSRLFQLQGQGRDTNLLDIGKDSADVTGKLVAKDGRKFANGFQVYASGGGKLSYPHEPKGLNHQESVNWWNTTWEAPKGREYLDYLSRNVQVPVSHDGSFHFPLLPAGEYELVLHCPSDEKLDFANAKFSVSEDQLGKTLDLGDLEIVQSER